MKKVGTLLSLILVLALVTKCSCEGRNRNVRENNTGALEDTMELQGKLPVAIAGTGSSKISKVNFYIENSASMFGYVNGITEYSKVLAELAEMPDFAAESTYREFFFVNGGKDLKITPIGNNPGVLKGNLNKNGFDRGEPGKSNLNSMFQVALEAARNDTISILISDGIYDIGKEDVLPIEGTETRSKFIQRLGLGDLQTLLIKLHSHFDGKYYPVGKKGIDINQTRPYYIWIFGDSKLLNRYFPENYIQSLEGYSDMARFLNFDGQIIPYQATSQNFIGRFRFDKFQQNKLIDVKPDRHGQGFQFSFATDFSKLPFSDSYLQTLGNYKCTENYEVVTITKISKKIPEVIKFTPTHLITVSSPQNPYGDLKVTLKNVIPDWIMDSSTDDESNIVGNTTQTFGFKFLTEAISEAYAFKSREKPVTIFTFELTK